MSSINFRAVQRTIQRVSAARLMDHRDCFLRLEKTGVQEFTYREKKKEKLLSLKKDANKTQNHP
jgi:hypothetical protein